MNLSARTSPVLVQGFVAAGQTTITPASGVYIPTGSAALVIAAFGTVTAGSVSAVQIQVSKDNGVTDAYSAIGGSGTAVPAGSGGLVLIDVYRPIKPWVLPVVTRTVQNAALAAIIVLIYEYGQLPPVPDLTVIASKLIAAGAPLGSA